MNDELNSFGYASSAPDLIQDITPPLKDEEEISTIEKLYKLIQVQKAELIVNAALDTDEKKFTLKEQLHLNAELLKRLEAQERTLKLGINKVKEHQYGRQF